MIYRIIFIAAIFNALCLPAWSQGGHGRRAASEILIMLGDARALARRKKLSALHRRGLEDRLRGGLAALPVLLRLATQESARAGRPTSGRATSGRPTSGRPTSGRPTSGSAASGSAAATITNDSATPQQIAAQARAALAQNEIARLRQILNDLSVAYPLRLSGIWPAAITPAQRASARELHDTICAGCHDEPDLDVARPAFNLTRQWRQMSPREFAARLMVGVRGDRVTGIGNPLSDAQMAALMAHYSAP